MGGFIEALLLPDASAEGLTPDDFVAELANIVCGNAVPLIYGRTAIRTSLVMAVTGMATLWMAVLADTGASVIVVGNALRLLRAR